MIVLKQLKSEQHMGCFVDVDHILFEGFIRPGILWCCIKNDYGYRKQVQKCKIGHYRKIPICTL